MVSWRYERMHSFTACSIWLQHKGTHEGLELFVINLAAPVLIMQPALHTRHCQHRNGCALKTLSHCPISCSRSSSYDDGHRGAGGGGGNALRAPYHHRHSLQRKVQVAQLQSALQLLRIYLARPVTVDRLKPLQLHACL